MQTDKDIDVSTFDIICIRSSYFYFLVGNGENDLIFRFKTSEVCSY